jgi:hypothetical protein
LGEKTNGERDEDEFVYCSTLSPHCSFVSFVRVSPSPVPLFASEAESDCQIPVMGRTVEPVILRVALYPFVPDRVALFEKLESRFECDHPGVNVVLVSSPNATDDYYADDKSAHKGFQYVSADVYEIDTILLAEFIALGKIAPISLPYDDF